MIKLVRPDKPKKLQENEKMLTEEYKKTGKPVWRNPYITQPLLEMSHGKCCYCETELKTQAKNMQVEHYHYKDGYPDEVVDWDNLLPSCSQCNSNKGTHDTKKDGEIINPTIDDPRDFLYLQCFMIKSKDNRLNSKGRLTVELLDLNNRERLINPRIKIAVEIDKKMQDIHKMMWAFSNRNDGKQYNKNRIMNGILELLKMAQPESEYSAFMATVLWNNKNYMETKELMKENALWTIEMQRLHDEMDKIRFMS